MNTRNLALGTFVVLTVAFASLAVIEYGRVNSLGSQIHSSQSTTASTTCTATGGIGCPHFFNDSGTISVNYTGPWGVNYQGYLGDQSSGQLVVSGGFYGHGTGSKSIAVAGISEYGTTICAQAEKLDASNSTLLLRILPPNVMNQTSLAYGTTETCLAHVIG